MDFDNMFGMMGPFAAGPGAVILINLMAFVLFGIDKGRARRDQLRVSERTLLTFAFLGGTIGAKLGQRVFRHKTRKQPFARVLNAICVLHLLLVAVLAIPSTHNWLFSGISSVLG